MSVLDNFESWKGFLHDRLSQGEQQGLSQEVVSDVAYQIGGYLADGVKAKNEQEQLLADLWHVASQEEQHAIANMMVKLVQNER
ncbi:DUF3243 family protein [Bacillus hwajinpoensis]|jgi:hypothetical protein|uniref:DUF3243 family protein n=1 Tax=Guptibacillus hwajinpoensis TaxID=208199 RepID=A0A845EZ30_9BACL|nr:MULTISPECIES: DUF3243 domain-containing protein [Bacillaceae]MCA0174277.1 DUF3243 domain-containing protein [Bacillus sp. RAR_GA_16]MYL63821.1 DUF3243 family protein [Pseudalkalibacillus hwajinpoensis]PFG13005.1 uncharacterized protein DUF3243 [Bacillus sp. es.036]QHA91823.1 DUF3243 family protein [Bacillus sp. N1-1]